MTLSLALRHAYRIARETILGRPQRRGYIAAKSALIAMSHTINREECLNGIRSTIISLGEIATEILKSRTTNPVTPEELARNLKPEDCADLVRYIACLPAHICISEVTFLPTGTGFM